jgi:hypothetical protein
MGCGNSTAAAPVTNVKVVEPCKAEDRRKSYDGRGQGLASASSPVPSVTHSNNESAGSLDCACVIADTENAFAALENELCGMGAE